MLWSTFKYADERFPFPWNQLFLFFFRSGQAPLTLELADLNLGEDHMNVASLLCNHQHRFKHVSIHFLKDEITTGDMNEAIELKNIPLLETLQLNMMCKTSPLRIQLQHAPCLTSLNLVVPYSVDFGDLIVPNLTDCVITQKIEFMTVNDCLTLLRSCPALINFSAETCFRGRQRVDFEDIYNPNLISFRLGCTESSASWSIMQRLRFPNLKRLSLLQNVFRGHVPGASALISRSQSLIESLELMSTSVDCIMQCLELSPNLERLSVSSCYEDGGANVRDVILRLTLESGERVCPRLKTIEFAYFDLSQHTGEIASMVKSRWHIEEGTRHLESVVFRFCKVSAFPDLDHCRDEGLNIDIIAPGYP
ncbi:hypothetical protein EW145_g3179 [Phellinidium pouzarii]|uniref:F-box domain-containing protein n=1 Tax=Phellinidium pouzarii TaxID=167371 RepID=A0A4S4LDK9_9AGAM|nr:hypothetical protein EW145_g3179 [Phellinidium pouzarii]